MYDDEWVMFLFDSIAWRLGMGNTGGESSIPGA